jgi:hypothetical protein
MAKRKKGGAMLVSKKKRSSKKPSTIPPLLERAPKPDKAKKAVKRVSKGLYEMVYGGLEAFANPLAPGSNLAVGKDSPVHTRNLTRRFLPGALKKLVPGGKPLPPKPKYGAGLIGPPEKPKTFRDRMRFRRKPTPK